MGLREQIVEAFDVESISETYEGPIEITDLKGELRTKGHILVVRGDLAYSDRLSKEEADIATPKLWQYEKLLNAPKVQEQLTAHPNHRLFDGVGFSSLAALGWHARQLGRQASVVMAREYVPNQEDITKYGMEVIQATGPSEEGYIKAQADVIKHRADIIPLHQALYGARALAPVGNNVVKQLEDIGIKPDATFWSIASGANLYGVGGKIKQAFPDCQTIVVEAEPNITLNGLTDLSNTEATKRFARKKLKATLDDWVEKGKPYSGILPLHAELPSRYLLDYWRTTGNLGFDRRHNATKDMVFSIRNILTRVNPEYDWTDTTLLTLSSAMDWARQGKDVLVMSYGKNREAVSWEYKIQQRAPWLFRWETPAQKIAATAASIGYLGLAAIGQFGFAKAFEEHPEAMKYFPFIN